MWQEALKNISVNAALIIGAIIVILGSAYAIARMVSIAHFRTREEYDRKSIRNLLDGENDAKSE